MTPPSININTNLTIDTTSRIPHEILSRVFFEYIDDIIDNDITSRTGPLLLISICQRWRTVALSTQPIWCRIKLSISQENAPSTSSLLSAWIVRSGVYPLTIDLSWDGEAPYTTYHPTVDILVESSDRWENISIFLPARIYNRSPLKSVRGNIPHLTHLSVGVLSDGSVADLPVHTWDMFEIAPKLVSFQCLNCCPTLFLVPWSQFTSIPSLSLGMDESIEILRNSPVLEEVTLLCGDGTPVFHPPVRHDHLKRLTIRSCVLDESDFDGFFKQVALDSLETLEIQVEYGSISSAFALFLSNTSTLRHLSLDGYAFEDSHIIEALENTPFLSSFAVRRRLLRNYDEIFTRLGTKHREGGFDLVPKLETLNITTFNWDLRSFIRLVELRAATLRDVRINADQPPDARLHAQLKSMESETLSITITTPIHK